MSRGDSTTSPTTRRLASPQSVESAQPKNFLQACLLLFLRESPAHGYALIERLEDIGAHSDRGVVYRTLRVLEREGMVESTWESSDAGPSRRSYALTPAGHEVLAAWAAMLTESARMLDEYLDRYKQVSKTLLH